MEEVKFVYHKCTWYWGKTVKIITNDCKGTIRVSFDDEHPAEAIIDSFSVVEDEQRKGIGTELLKEAERIIKERKVVGKIILWAVKGSWTVDWYERNGYIVTDDSDKYECIMTKKI